MDSAVFYHKYLKTFHGKIAQEYLKQRSIDEKIINEFLLGFAPDSWDVLYSAAAGSFNG